MSLLNKLSSEYRGNKNLLNQEKSALKKILKENYMQKLQLISLLIIKWKHMGNLKKRINKIGHLTLFLSGVVTWYTLRGLIPPSAGKTEWDNAQLMPWVLKREFTQHKEPYWKWVITSNLSQNFTIKTR